MFSIDYSQYRRIERAENHSSVNSLLTRIDQETEPTRKGIEDYAHLDLVTLLDEYEGDFNSVIPHVLHDDFWRHKYTDQDLMAIIESQDLRKDHLISYYQADLFKLYLRDPIIQGSLRSEKDFYKSSLMIIFIILRSCAEIIHENFIICLSILLDDNPNLPLYKDELLRRFNMIFCHRKSYNRQCQERRLMSCVTNVGQLLSWKRNRNLIRSISNNSKHVLYSIDYFYLVKLMEQNVPVDQIILDLIDNNESRLADLELNHVHIFTHLLDEYNFLEQHPEIFERILNMTICLVSKRSSTVNEKLSKLFYAMLNFLERNGHSDLEYFLDYLKRNLLKDFFFWFRYDTAYVSLCLRIFSDTLDDFIYEKGRRCHLGDFIVDYGRYGAEDINNRNHYIFSLKNKPTFLETLLKISKNKSIILRYLRMFGIENFFQNCHPHVKISEE